MSLNKYSAIIWVLLMAAVTLHGQVTIAQSPFPLASDVTRVRKSLASSPVEPTGLSRKDYLEVIAGITKYFRQFQTNDGRIIDPFQHKEVQYSTPCFAWAAAVMVASGRDTNLLEAAALALDSSLQELADSKAADGHGDFFTFPAMLAYEQLRDRVPPARRQRWEQLFRNIDPARAYHDVVSPTHPTVHNWNLVATAGEWLRHTSGFTDTGLIERNLEKQLEWFTPNGLYRDPNEPMAYDHFPRHFIAAMLHRGYDGNYRDALSELMERAAWTSLLMQSPRGELPTGGRSAQHQWNEGEQCVTYEIWADRKHRERDAAAAGAFKRAAHLALQSIQRWVRPSGELWIVKNRFDPEKRFGFETYSSHSQYNLLTASMLASAWSFADDKISENAAPADVGGFAIELPEHRKIIANAGGLYLEIETGADPHYNSTGLVRLHKKGVDSMVGPSDSAPAEKEPLAVGIAWREEGRWQSLAGLGRKQITGSRLSVLESTPQRVRFSVRYEIGRANVRAVVENYELTPERVRVTAEVEGNVADFQVRFPAFAFDGQRTSQIHVHGSKVEVRLGASTEAFQVEWPPNVELKKTEGRIACRNGYLEIIKADCPGKSAVYTLTPRAQP